MTLAGGGTTIRAGPMARRNEASGCFVQNSQEKAMMMKLGKRFGAAFAAGVAFLALASSQARADGPAIVIEKGTAGSGIKEIKHIYSQNGLRPPLRVRWQSARETFYEDGHNVIEKLN